MFRKDCMTPTAKKIGVRGEGLSLWSSCTVLQGERHRKDFFHSPLPCLVVPCLPRCPMSSWQFEGRKEDAAGLNHPSCSSLLLFAFLLFTINNKHSGITSTMCSCASPSLTLRHTYRPLPYCYLYVPFSLYSHI